MLERIFQGWFAASKVAQTTDNWLKARVSKSFFYVSQRIKFKDLCLYLSETSNRNYNAFERSEKVTFSCAIFFVKLCNK